MRNLRILITFLLLSINLYSSTITESMTGSSLSKKIIPICFLEKSDDFFQKQNYEEVITSYKSSLKEENIFKAPVLKKIALGYSALKKTKESISYVEKYLQTDFKPSVLADTGFDPIRDTAEFSVISKRYTPTFSFWSFIYLYVALIGFYISIIIHFNKRIDNTSKKIISAFIFIHSIFILHIFLYTTNYHFIYPHSYLMSAVFSFLYGPLLYFYFKRITQNYEFRTKDIFHLTPTLLVLIYLIPKYTLPASKKLQLLIEETAGYTVENSKELILAVTLKVLSLIIYGLFIRKLFIQSNKNSSLPKKNRVWQRNIYRIHFSYILCYSLYATLTLNNMSVGIFFNLQIFFMASMILYIGYSANAQPKVFSGSLLLNNNLSFKYEKSGLTKSLSNELKNNLIELFDTEKIYKENDINLEMLAARLSTTRHNASQVINEHFSMSFHELINTYRINEAKEILHKDIKRNMNIIDIAYEVGYNNKVTFNKAFKKDTQLTPSQ
ncbi:helix-turn-helix transcriptional regulator, partial [Maribacter sp.]|uniref:helix-turn-helix domain-containing protein n=1 Tax=Maribacter sp. TaxID=1897614 RepID=UPI0025BA5736